MFRATRRLFNVQPNRQIHSQFQNRIRDPKLIGFAIPAGIIGAIVGEIPIISYLEKKMPQKNTTVRNYSVISFYNAVSAVCGQIATRFNSHTASSGGSLNFFTSNASVVGLVMSLTQSKNVLIGKVHVAGADPV